MTSPGPEAKQRLHLDGLLHEMQRYPADRAKTHRVELKGFSTCSSHVTVQLSQHLHRRANRIQKLLVELFLL